METQKAYNDWAKTYDTVVNKTRDLEAKVIRSVLANTNVEKIIEIGCGTGKNTLWLADKCKHLTAVDFSPEMLELAKQKINSPKVNFQQADITEPWTFAIADLITCSLVLEHIQHIDVIFQQASSIVRQDGQFYICELHPYKQLLGSRAKFEKDGNLLELEYFVHHISDYLKMAEQNGFICNDLQEWFDTEERNQVPRLISFLFRKK